MDEIRWGIIGCGDIAEKRGAPAINAIRGARLQAVMSRDIASAEAFASRFGAGCAYGSVNALLADPRIDAVYVSTPVASHAEITALAANAGKHVLCEKPMAISGDEAREAVLACQRADVKLGIAYYRRYYPKMQRVRELIQSGVIGEPIQSYIQFHDRVLDEVLSNKRWIVQPEISGGGAGMDLGCHLIDLLCYCLNQSPDSVYAQCDMFPGYDVEQTLNLAMHFSSGCDAMVSSSFRALKKTTRFYLYGTTGSIEMQSIDDAFFTVESKNIKETHMLIPSENTLVPVFTDMMDAIQSGRQLISPGCDCIIASDVLSGAYRSIEIGEPVLIIKHAVSSAC